MNIENAKQEFIKYLEQYDVENNLKMERKVEHSFRVMENAGEIAESLELNKEEIEIAKLIGLLHDIGRFEQIRIYNTFQDHISIDHGDLGVEILKKANYIRKYIDEDKYDNIILKVIKNHNKFAIEEGLTDRELLFAKIIRDADKLDIFYEGAEIFWNTEKEIKEKEESKITPEILGEFNAYSLIDRRKSVTPLDGIVGFIAFLFDINFKYTFESIKEKDYINIILDKFNIKDEETKKQIEEVRKIAKKYMENKI